MRCVTIPEMERRAGSPTGCFRLQLGGVDYDAGIEIGKSDGEVAGRVSEWIP